MATKTMTVLEDVTFKLPISELASGSMEPEKYRVALVSFQNSADAGLRTLTLSQLLLVPLTWKEFVKRVRGGLDQSHALEENNIVQFGRVSIDLMSMEVRRSDRAVSLTAVEFKVLRFFVTNPKRVISRDRLLNEVWGYQRYPCTAQLITTFLSFVRNLSRNLQTRFTFKPCTGLVTSSFPEAS